MNRQCALAALAVGFLALTSSGVRGAGTNAAEEAAIRKQIATINGGASRDAIATADRIVFLSNMKRPIVGPEKAELITPPATPNPNVVPGSERLRIDVLRLVVADSGDLAYEYSRQVAERDMKNGTHTISPTPSGVLRVWQKQGGTWKIAAVFNFPYTIP